MRPVHELPWESTPEPNTPRDGGSSPESLKCPHSGKRARLYSLVSVPQLSRPGLCPASTPEWEAEPVSVTPLFHWGLCHHTLPRVPEESSSPASAEPSPAVLGLRVPHAEAASAWKTPWPQPRSSAHIQNPFQRWCLITTVTAAGQRARDPASLSRISEGASPDANFESLMSLKAS